MIAGATADAVVAAITVVAVFGFLAIVIWKL